MEAPRNERDSGSDSDFQSVYKDLYDLSNLTAENATVEEITKDGESPDDREENYKELSSDVQFQRLFEPENMTNRCANCESTSSNKTPQLDANIINSPLVNLSEDEQSETANNHHATPRGDTETKFIFNTKALPKEAKTYELEKFQKNCLIIFNQETIDGFEPRLGTAQDVQALTETFTNFGFEVVEHKDLTKDQIIEVLETFQTKNFTEYGCVGVVVLTHGRNSLLRAKDQEYSETDILRYLQQQPTLVTKPKLFMIQACRGSKLVPAVQVQPWEHLRKDADEEVEPYTLPIMSDVLIVHSSYEEEVSFRNEIHGSWFIQTICSKINEMSATNDLESILIEMKREVATDRHWEHYNRLTGEMDIFKQMPTVTSTLIRKLYLRKFGDDSPPIILLDTAVTPLPYMFGSCSCFLDHFDYIKRCLTFFVEENPNDVSARVLLETSNSYENKYEFNDKKIRMAIAISDYLNHNARHCKFFKYLYFYKNSPQ